MRLTIPPSHAPGNWEMTSAPTGAMTAPGRATVSLGQDMDFQGFKQFSGKVAEVITSEHLAVLTKDVES
jgi:hypothetical protein